MSRSGYIYDFEENWSLICWRGAVNSAIKGKRGQAFLKELLAGSDAMENKRLITNDLLKDGEVCAIGVVGVARGINMGSLDPYSPNAVADVFGIAPALTSEIFYINDECSPYKETPEARYTRMRRWAKRQIKSDLQVKQEPL